MKIALIGPDPSFKGGIGQYNHFFAREVLRQGHELCWIGFARQYPKFLYPPGTGDGVSINPVKAPLTSGRKETLSPYHIHRILSWDRPLSWRAAAERIEAFDPAVVVVPWWTFFWYPWFGPLLSRLSRVPRVVIAHNAADHESGGLRGILSRLTTRRILARADRVIVQSNDEKEQVERMGARAVVVIHHPLYPQFAATVDRAEARERLDIPPDARLLLLFGAVRPYKGADLFAEAIARLPGLTGIIAGEIWDERLGAELRDRASRHPNLRILDRYFDDEEGALLFAACDAVALPYRSVTGSGAAMAALGAGKPLIAADLPLFREIFAPPLATFFRAGDVDALTAVTERFFTTNNNLQSTEALAIIRERFGWDRPVRAVTAAAGVE